MMLTSWRLIRSGTSCDPEWRQPWSLGGRYGRYSVVTGFRGTSDAYGTLLDSHCLRSRAAIFFLDLTRTSLGG